MTTKKPQIRRRLSKTVLTCFYFSCLLGWLWSLLFYLPIIIPFLEKMQHAQSSSSETYPVTLPDFSLPQPIAVTVGIICVIGAIACIVYVLLKAPKVIRKSGDTISHSATSTITPLVAKHRTLSPKQKRHLSLRVLFYCRFALCILPLLISFGVASISTPIPTAAIICLSAILSSLSLCLLVVFSLLTRDTSRTK